VGGCGGVLGMVDHAIETPTSVSDGFARAKLLRWCKDAVGAPLAAAVVNFDNRHVHTHAHLRRLTQTEGETESVFVYMCL
jgi:hypothetical protein